jgi:hypothetical protein
MQQPRAEIEDDALGPGAAESKFAGGNRVSLGEDLRADGTTAIGIESLDQAGWNCVLAAGAAVVSVDQDVRIDELNAHESSMRWIATVTNWVMDG